MHNPDLNWDILPAELRPNKQKRDLKKDTKPNLSLKKPNLDIERRLRELESKEKSGKEEGSDQEKKDKDDSDEDEEGKSVGNNSGGEEQDEEMDDGTDYASNYFDNGEAFEDGEDDNLEDGDVY